MQTRSKGLLLVLAGIAVLILVVVSTRSASDRVAGFVGARVSLGKRVQAATVGSKTLALETETDASGVIESFARFDSTGPVSVKVTRDGGTTDLELDILPRRWFWIAGLGIFLLLLGIPYAVEAGKGARDTLGNPVRPWYCLLSEAAGGYSLARVQLLIWFAPAVVLYGGLCVSLRRFVDIDATMAVLLGLSGATTLLGTAANPPSAAVPQPGAPVEPPKFSDLVTDWRQQGDLSRYQYLLLSIVGAVTIVAAFVSSFRLPAVPPQLLGLLGVSQATYMGTKAVKNA